MRCAEAVPLGGEESKLVWIKVGNKDVIRACLEEAGVPLDGVKLSHYRVVFDYDVEPAGELRVIRAADEELICSLSEPAVLVYRDNMAPGWRASLDGEDAELLVVDRVNKAVAVPPGQHRVEFVYRPWLYLVAFALRAVVLIGALAACAWLAVRACRMPKAM